MINTETPRDGFLFGDQHGPWSTEHLTRALTRETLKRIGFRMTTQDYRHIAIAIDRKFIRGKHAEVDEEEEEEDDVHDEMAAHSTKVAIAHYARMGGLSRNLTPESLDVFRSISDKWQRWYGLVSRKQSSNAKTIQSTQKGVQSTKEKMYGVIQKLYGPTGEFRTRKQEQAVEAVIEGVSPLIVVLPTGAGKSLSFMIPALLPDAGTTVVITPLVALAEDLLIRCKDAKVDCILYGRGPLRMATVIIVVTESAVTGSFNQFILDIHLKGRLDRIVLDEVHKLMMDSNFRPKLDDIRKLALPVQYVSLTATLPPSLLERYNDFMCFHEPTVIREVNKKPRVRYRIQRISDEDLKKDTKQLLNGELEFCHGIEKVLVFCRSRGECDSWARQFNCGVYYSDSKEKSETLKNWKAGLLFATGALGAGVDIKNIKSVIHLGVPYGAINFDQEVGRGGREGQIVDSIILIADGDFIRLLAEDASTLPPDEAAMRELIVTSECRRVGLSQYMNGISEGMSCTELDGEVCDNCLATASGVSARKRRLEADREEVRQRKRVMIYKERERQMQQVEMDRGSCLEEMIERHEWLQDKCAVCWLVHDTIEREHVTKECDVLTNELGERYAKFRTKISYRSNTSCYGCGRPGDLCEGYKNKRGCRGRDVVLPLVVLAYVKLDLGYRDGIREVSQREFVDLKDFCGWMTEKCRFMGENGTNAWAVWEGILRRRSELN